MSEQTIGQPPAGDKPVAPPEGKNSNNELFRKITQGPGLVSVLGVFVALVIGGLLVAVTDKKVIETAGYVFARPSDFFTQLWRAGTESYVALFNGSIYNSAQGFSPFLETLTVSTPLICAGLGVALAFRAGMFNIGAQGQIIIGATMAGYVGFAWHLPLVLHLLLVVLFGLLGGALWGGLVGLFKARTGAHEVILTIMFNYVALYLLDFLMNTTAFRRPGETNPISPILDANATFPALTGSRLHLGFVMAILLTVLVAWMLKRSTLGFEFRAVGHNPEAARTAGVNVARTTILAMAFAGALAGAAGVAQVAGTEKVLTVGVAGSLGFDAITVALLGRSTPWGTFFAGLLFGAFRAGAVNMQISTGTPIDIVLVVQSLIVLFIAAPPLVKSIFGMNPKKRVRKTETIKAGAK